MILRLVVTLVVALAVPLAAQPGRPLPGTLGDFTIHNFKFASGESLPILRVHYRTLGKPRRDARGVVRNAVLILHGTTGSGNNFLTPIFAGELFGSGQPLDTTKYYVILRDAIGHGQSSRPSDGLRARFPHYTYDDIVETDYRLLVERLGVAHLRLVMGTSMGGMLSWVWAERHPDFMDGVVPLACAPTQIAGRNRMMRRMAMDDIRSDPAWKNGDYTSAPPGLRAALQILWFMTSAPLVQQREAPTRQAADSLIEHFLESRMRATDANDFLYAFDASRDYNPESGLDRIRAAVLAINSADDQVNPPELGIVERLITQVQRGRFILIPIGPDTHGHGTHTVAKVWKKPFGEFLESLPPLPLLH